MQNNETEYSIARCQILVQDAQRYLDAAGKWSLSDSLQDVLNRLPSISRQFQRRDEEIKSLKQRIASERQARIDAQQEKQALLENAKLREDDIKKHLATIRSLDKGLKTAQADVKKNYDKGYQAGKDAERKRQNQPGSDFEDLIRRELDKGTEKFRKYDFDGALKLLKEAQTSILSLPAARRPLFDNTKLRYQIAICGAYVNDLAASEKSLSNFVQTTFSTASSEEDMLNLAHAQHLLAQVYIGQNKILDAQSICRHSNEIRWQYLPSADNRRYQSVALSARLVDLQDQRGANLLREAIHDTNTRSLLKEAYSKLKPLQAGTDPRNEPYILSEPATELLPIWTMKAKATPNKPQVPDNKPTVPKPSTVDAAKRTKWLDGLQLTNIDGQRLNPALEQAIRSSDLPKVSQLLTSNPPARPVAPALHIAALFNETQIATILLQHGADPLEPCNARSSKGDTLPGILPMHCAVGAQHEAMIRLLVSHKADFLPTTRQRKVSAPPLWLISERWLSLTGKDDVESVVGILRVMRSLGWRKGDRINREEYKMREVVGRNLAGRREGLKRGVLAYLDSI